MILKLMLLSAAAAALTASTVAATNKVNDVCPHSGKTRLDLTKAEEAPQEPAVYVAEPAAEKYDMEYMFI